MDFFRIRERSTKNGVLEVYPDFIVKRTKDLMVRSKSFYAIWDQEQGLWSTDEYDVQRLVDEKLYEHKQKRDIETDSNVHVKYLGDFSSNSWMQFRSYVSHLSDSSVQLDENLAFKNTNVRKEDYVSKRLPYSLAPGKYDAWDELVGTLYDPQERAKLEWAIGAIVAGEAKHIQKFIVLYGAAGAGKSTILNIVQKLFEGYYTTFEAKSLTGNANAFATEVFKANPLVAIQHDGDLSKIEDNTKLNSIVSHEEMTMNEKYKPSYTSRINAFLFMGTNKPVKITDAKSGIIRRLIDVQPSGNKLPATRYHSLVGQIDFELGAIAHHCLQVYSDMGKNYYNTYRPVEMMLQTDVFYNYIEAYFDVFKEQDGVSLNQAHDMYKQYCDESLIEFKLPRYKFREELKNYFLDFHERHILEDGTRVRSWYSGFLTDKFAIQPEEQMAPTLVLDQTSDILDRMLREQPAQYANELETPRARWDSVETTLADLDTTKLHYVKLPTKHIVIDFDIRNMDGEKDAELNLIAASKWPTTYAEHSKSGAGIHLHYIYDGDATELSRIFDEGIEIKVFVGNASLRRIKTHNNGKEVSTISGGLPLKEKKMIDADSVKSERALRNLIDRNLRKEFHPGTKPSMDFIHKILEDAYASDLVYDVSDMLPAIIAFANNSTNQAQYCISLINKLKISSGEKVDEKSPDDDQPLTFFDVEVFPNLFIISWKYEGPDTSVVRMVNPKPHEVEKLFKHKLVGFNNKKYDNHILYGAYMGYTNEQLYNLSQRIIGQSTGYFREAYGLSYADIYDFSSKKQGLKKFQIELGLNHVENPVAWDQPVPEERWDEIGSYCDNDVRTTEQVFNARRQDFVAREILSDLSGLSVNASTQQHTAAIIFEGDKDYKKQLQYTDLKEDFPGYIYEGGKSTYKGEVTGEGGYVYAEPGYYENVAVLDIASMHPTTMVQLNLFGKYTKNLSALLNARLYIKHGDYAAARKTFGGQLAPHLEDEEQAEALSYALKIVINIIYGLTAAKFDNPFRDNRNKDNIVAKRGALFMIDLKQAVQDQGFPVVHIKTDSIKIPNATEEIIEFVMEYGENYGYTFEHEDTFDKFCLVNDAVYIARVRKGRKPAHWEAVGAQFQHPYVYKTLFSEEVIEFRDLCETKSVTTALYLDFASDKPMHSEEAQQGPAFVGKVGRFVPVKQGSGGGLLLREKDGKFYSASGAKGYFWREADQVQSLGLEDDIDLSYFEALVDAAVKKIGKYVPIDEFTAS